MENNQRSICRIGGIKRQGEAVHIKVFDGHARQLLLDIFKYIYYIYGGKVFQVRRNFIHSIKNILEGIV